MPAPRQKRILFWVSICGVLALVVSPFCVPIYALNKGKSALRKAEEAYEKAGLPTDWGEIASTHTEDSLPRLMRRLYELSNYKARRIISSTSIAEGLTWQEIKKNTDVVLCTKLVKPRRGNSQIAREIHRWELTEEERQMLDEFCQFPMNLELIGLMEEACGFDSWQARNMDGGLSQYYPRPHGYYLRLYQLHTSLKVAEGNSSLDELYKFVLMELKLQDLTSQLFTEEKSSADVYMARCGAMNQAIQLCMYYDRLHGTPPLIIDQIANWTDGTREKEVLLNHHDHLRLVSWPLHFKLSRHACLMDPEQMGIGPGLLSLKPGPSTTTITHIPYTRVLRTKQLPDGVRQPFAQAAMHLIYAKNLEMLLPTRGVELSHYVAAKDFHGQDFSRIEYPWITRPTYSDRDQDFIGMIEAYHQRLQWQEIYVLGQAINRHADQHGSLPATLNDLDSDILSSIPTDRFPIGSSNPLIYHVDGEQFKLRSVGVNGIDDDGSFYPLTGDRGYPDADDLAFTGRRAVLPEPIDQE